MAGEKGSTGRRFAKSEVVLQAAEAFRLSCQRVPLRRIAEQLDISVGTAQSRVEQGRSECITSTVEEARQMDLEFIDAALLQLKPKLDEGSPTAHQAAARWLERRSRLLGLDKPLALEHSGTVSHYHSSVEDELAAWSRELGLSDPSLSQG